TRIDDDPNHRPGERCSARFDPSFERPVESDTAYERVRAQGHGEQLLNLSTPRQRVLSGTRPHSDHIVKDLQANSWPHWDLLHIEPRGGCWPQAAVVPPS